MAKRKKKNLKIIPIALCTTLVIALAVLLIIYLGLKPVPVGTYKNETVGSEYTQLTPFSFVIKNEKFGTKIYYTMKKKEEKKEKGATSIYYEIKLTKYKDKNLTVDGSKITYKKDATILDKVESKTLYEIAKIKSLTFVKNYEYNNGKKVDKITITPSLEFIKK